ncbi:MAG TPA: PAS domain S-box protein [Methanobacterium sp.]|nr:PAS domain S-box protein [Methanobacterium sp.]
METSHESANASQFKIFDNMLEGVSVYKLINDKGKVIDGILKYMNPVTVKMMGLNPDEFIGKNVLEFLDPCFIKPYLDVTNEFRVTGKYKRFEVYYPPTDKYFIVSGFDMSNNLFAVLRTDVTQQKKAEKALRQEVSRTSKILKELKESEQRFKSIFEHSNDAIIIADLKTDKFVDINKKTEELTGYSKEELPYMAVGDLASDSMKKEDIKQFNLTKHRPCRIETELSRKDGRVIPIELTIAVIEIDNKKYAQGVVRDISELKKAEGHFHKEVKRESFLLELYKKSPQLSDKELYERALDHAVSLTDSSIGFFHLISDDQKNIILDTWNKKALSTCKAPFKTHYPIEQAGNWTDCVPAKGPVVYNDFKNSPNRKGYPEGHVNVKRFISVPVFDEDKVKFIFGVGNKIEEYDGHDVIQIQSVANELYKIIKQRHWEQALKEAHDNLEKKVKERTYELENAYGLLKESEEKFRLIFNEAEDSIVLNEMMENGLPGKIIEANSTTSKRLRYTREELLNMSPLEIVAPEKRVEMSKNAEQLRKKGHVIFETIHVAKDGRRIPAEVNNHLIEFNGKETAITIVRDITNRKEMEKRLKETIQKLERSNKELHYL